MSAGGWRNSLHIFVLCVLRNGKQSSDESEAVYLLDRNMDVRTLSFGKSERLHGVGTRRVVLIVPAVCLKFHAKSVLNLLFSLVSGHLDAS